MGACLIGEFGQSRYDRLHGGDLGLVLVVGAGDEAGHAGKFGADLKLGGDAVVKAEGVGDLVGVEVGAGGVEYENAVLVLVTEYFGAKGGVGPLGDADFGEFVGVLCEAFARHAAEVAEEGALGGGGAGEAADAGEGDGHEQGVQEDAPGLAVEDEIAEERLRVEGQQRVIEIKEGVGACGHDTGGEGRRRA